MISEDAVSDHPKYRPLPYRASFEPKTPTPQVQQSSALSKHTYTAPLRPLKTTRVLPQILPDHRANKPQARSCGFLDKNVMFLNEPICNVRISFSFMFTDKQFYHHHYHIHEKRFIRY